MMCKVKYFNVNPCTRLLVLILFMIFPVVLHAQDLWNVPVTASWEETADGAALIKGRVILPAATEHIFAVITGSDSLKNFVPNLIGSEVTGIEGDTRIVLLTGLVDFFLFSKSLSVRLRFTNNPPDLITCELVDGPFHYFDGVCRILPGNGQSEIDIEIKAKPSFFVPDFLISFVVKRHFKRGLEAVRDEIRLKYYSR